VNSANILNNFSSSHKKLRIFPYPKKHILGFSGLIIALLFAEYTESFTMFVPVTQVRLQKNTLVSH